ncbi:ABC transporter ATP-binding protein [Phytoactinopolyspora limicola]|uniref:ABC transporter ATP-binding protein n=1 Tax=Phytoactinopolyspora limicola TaxID=2715536 RepID=UPI001409834C|nr:ABC transporter ATP-binding protein [Phytoactinopolyspora limicola]
MSAVPVVSCVGVTKRFESLTAVDRLDLDIPAGIVFGYLGPNGAGKTTTIRMIMGLARPTSGSLALFGVDPASPRNADVRMRVGYLPGELRLDEKLTSGEQLEHWARLRGPTSVDATYRDALVDRLGLALDRPVRTLSTGNRRKVGLVGAFMSRPELLVLDEPTSGLDPLMQQEFLSMVDEVRAEGRTVLLSSHVLSEVERLADRVVVLRAGQMVLDGAVPELQRQALQKLTATFNGAPPVAELEGLAAVTDVTVDGATVTCRITGPVHPVLDVLARHRVEAITAPQREIEDAFLDLYDTSGSPEQPNGADT